MTGSAWCRLGDHEEVRDLNGTDKKTITVGVHGGLVQWIQGIPDDVRVVVRDYDVDGADAENLTRDAQGDLCAEGVWKHEDSEQGES